jgi:dephospho-CoA kinase
MPRLPVDETRLTCRLAGRWLARHEPWGSSPDDELATLGRIWKTLSFLVLPSTNMARYSRRPASGSPPRGPWKHGTIPVIGLIGGIGAGKSQVAAALAEHGAHVLDADAIGHALLDQTPARNQVLKRFGEGILDHSATAGAPARINRLALGAIVFAQPKALKDLEAILHPRMKDTFQRAIARAVRNRKVPAVVLDAAVLLEANWNDLCDVIVFVDAPRETRLARLAAQRGWTAETLDARERMQRPLEEKRRQADHVLVNDADPGALREGVSRLWQTIAKPAQRVSTTRPHKPATAPAADLREDTRHP